MLQAPPLKISGYATDHVTMCFACVHAMLASCQAHISKSACLLEREDPYYNNNMLHKSCYLLVSGGEGDFKID